MRMKIPLIIEEAAGLDRPDFVALGGAPLARGQLTEGGWFNLTADGGDKALVEGAPAAYWPDGSVKWLHLCGQVPLAASTANRFLLEPANEEPDERLTVTRQDGRLSLRGGPLEVDVAPNAERRLEVRRVGAAGDCLDGPGISAEMVAVGPEGGQPRSYPWRPLEEEPRIVNQGANRVVVRLSGFFQDESEATVGELIIFLEVYRQSPEVRLEPVFIYLGDPREDLIASLRLTVHTTLQGDDPTTAFGNERGEGFWDRTWPIRDDERGGDGPRWAQARQVQLGSSFFKTEKRVGPEGSWVKALEGQRAQGWCHLANEQHGVTGAMRYYWQEYPHSLGLDADAGELAFGLHPNAAEPLDLRRYSPKLYGGAMYEAGGTGPFRHRLHGAYGIAKAHELMLRFHPPEATPREVAAAAVSFTRPCRVQCAPEHFAQTQVIGQIAPTEPAVDEGVEAKAAEITDFMLHEREVRGWYGLMNYGDIMSSYHTDGDRWAYDDGGYAWINSESLPDLGLWISALRSARADWLEAAIEMTRHNRDIDAYHRGQLKGCGTRHNVNHWGCADKEWRVAMPYVRRFHYYLTADPWTAEVIRDTVAVYQAYERTTGTAPRMTSALAGVLVKWEMTAAAEDAETLKNFADLFASAVREDGQIIKNMHADIATGQGYTEGDEVITGLFFLNTFGGQHAMVEVAELLGHEALSEAIVRYVRFCTTGERENGDHFSILPFLAHAYRHTGEEHLKELIAKSLTKRRMGFEEIGGNGLLADPPHWIMPGMKRRNKIACHGLGDYLHLSPYGLAVTPSEPAS